MEQSNGNDPVIVDGVRTPFMRSNKTYEDLPSYELGRMALSGLAAKTGLDLSQIDHVAMGTVIHDPVTSNVARESLLAAGYPNTIPAHTVSLACISSNVAATQAADMIKLNRIAVAVVGGTDTCSDPPIRVSRQMRKGLVRLSKMKKASDFISQWPFIRTLKLSDFALDVPKVVEFSNGKSMGQGADILAQQTGVSREESDAFAARSHQLAAKAQKDGIFKNMIVPAYLPPRFDPVLQDDGPRGDTTQEALARLKPAFDKFGVNTAGSSSFLTDGASAMLMMSRAKAKELGFKGKACIRDYIYGAGDALSEMLSGPALTIPLLLARNKLKASDVQVWEIHEAFSAQVLANLKLIESRKFLKDRLGLSDSVGSIAIDRVNIWGGSLSLGHPFGATGARLLATAAMRLSQDGHRYAIVSGCAAGGHGSAILLENIE